MRFEPNFQVLEQNIEHIHQKYQGLTKIYEIMTEKFKISTEIFNFWTEIFEIYTKMLFIHQNTKKYEMNFPPPTVCQIRITLVKNRLFGSKIYYQRSKIDS